MMHIPKLGIYKYSFFILIIVVGLMANNIYGEKTNVYIERAEISNQQLISFLRDTILPIAEANNFDLNKDQIILYNNLNQQKDTIKVLIQSCDMYRPLLKKLYNEKYKYYAQIKILPIFIISNCDSVPWINPLGVKHNCGFFEDNELLLFCDAEAQWRFELIGNVLSPINFQNEGLDWFSNIDSCDYIPHKILKNIKKNEFKKPNILDGLKGANDIRPDFIKLEN